MKKIKWFIIICLFFVQFVNFSRITVASSLSPSEEKVVKKAWRSVVKVEGIVDNQYSMGTGVAISNRIIVTNTHVTQGSRTLTIHWKKKLLTGLVIYENEKLDIAFVSVPIALPVLDISKHKPRLNQKVYALGYPNGVPTISSGNIIGAKIITGFAHIESDVIMTSGNSGGALIDEHGNLIAINRAIMVDVISYRSGLSIPSLIIKNELKKLKKEHLIPSTSERGTLGVLTKSIDYLRLADGYIVNVPSGIYVENVLPNSTAYKSGILKGDIIISVQNVRVKNLPMLLNVLDGLIPGRRVNITILRLGSVSENSIPKFKEFTFKLELGKPYYFN